MSKFVYIICDKAGECFGAGTYKRTWAFASKAEALESCNKEEIIVKYKASKLGD